MNFYNKISGTISKNIPPPLRKAIGQVFGTQMLFQFMGLGISVLLVRVLPKSEYAIYTVLMAVLGMLGIISNSGIMIGFKKIGGKIWDKNQEFSDLIKTTFSIRKYLILFSFVIVGTYTILVFNRQEIALNDSLFFIVALFFMVVPNASVSILAEGLLLQKNFLPVQIQTIVNQSIRMLGIFLLFLIFKDSLTIKSVLVITVIASWTALFYLRRKEKKNLQTTSGKALKEPKINTEYKRVLMKYIKLNWHNSIFFAFKDQIAILIIGLYGTTSGLADLGAITRFSMIFLGVNALATNLLGPSFGRSKKFTELVKISKITFIAFIIISIITLTAAFIFSEELLWLLGPKYGGLNHELFMVFVLSCMMLGVHILNILNNSKGWIKYSPKFEILIGIAGILLGVLFFDISTPIGGLYLSILSFFLMLCLYSLNYYYGLFIDKDF
ncbi:lipopolysaccharide biosynthesis protein [Maribacter aquivivus]|uniref:lipopolysaccharide biosynthesis protein n=1 Tax=Maribacter aquivivus TaxID=228958 RepID=UPI0024937607|nr:hypothetical protein [Maribacter aquivivus]